MSAPAVSLLVFVSIFDGTLGGMWLRTKLPEDHLSDGSQSVVKLGIGLVATLAALVLGLFIASANNTYNSERAQINEITANIILLDNVLAAYGPETTVMRMSLRQAIGPFVSRLWREESSETERRARS